MRPCALPEPDDKAADVTAWEWAEALALFKASGVADECDGELVLGADTIVVCDGELLGKPRDLDDARRMLEMQGGRETQVITGIALLDSGDQRNRIIRHAVTRVWMRDDATEREAYLRGGEWRGKAGAYGIQDVGDKLVERIEGSFSNVVGLPLELTLRVLERVRIEGFEGANNRS